MLAVGTGVGGGVGGGVGLGAGVGVDVGVGVGVGDELGVEVGATVGLDVAVGGTAPTEPPHAASINPSTSSAATNLWFTRVHTAAGYDTRSPSHSGEGGPGAATYLSVEGAFGLRRLDLDDLVEGMDASDGVVQGHRLVGRRDVGNLQVIAPAVGPHQRRHAEHATTDRLGMFLRQRREVDLGEVAVEPFQVQTCGGCCLAVSLRQVRLQVAFVARSLEREPESIEGQVPLASGGDGGTEGRDPGRLPVTVPDWLAALALSGAVVLAQ